VQYKRELEEARRWAVTPPEPPEGLDDDVMGMWKDVMAGLTSDQPRLCRLGKWGRSLLQSLEDASWQNRRLTRPRSAGTLGLGGPPTVDCSKRFEMPPQVEGGLLERKLQVGGWGHARGVLPAQTQEVGF
jgi:hypothetical protein